MKDRRIPNIYLGLHTSKGANGQTFSVPYFAIIKQNKNQWFISTFNPRTREYEKITNSSWFKTLKEAKHHIDVEIFEFFNCKGYFA